MSLRSFLSKERSRDRTLFVACGIGFVAYAAWHFWRGSWGVACFLGGFGLLSLAAGALLSEQRLNTLATVLLLINFVAAAAALVAAVGVQ